MIPGSRPGFAGAGKHIGFSATSFQGLFGKNDKKRLVRHFLRKLLFVQNDENEKKRKKGLKDSAFCGMIYYIQKVGKCFQSGIFPASVEQ